MSEVHSRNLNMQLFANIFVFFTFFMIPFLGGNHLSLYYINIDRFWIETLFTILLIISALLTYLNQQRGQSAFLGFARYFVPFLLLSAVSLLYSWNRFSTLNSLSILILALGAVYVFLMSTKKEVCFAGLVAGAALSSFAAILQHQILFPNLMKAFTHGRYASLLMEQSGIPFASYAYHNILGGYLAFILPLAIYLTIYRKSISSGIASSLIITGVVLTSTRIGLAIVLLGLIANLIIFIYSRNRLGILKVLGVVTLSAIICLSLLYGGKTGKNTGVQNVIAQKAKTAYTQLSTLNTRTDIWKNGLAAFRNSPLVGYGAGTFEYAYRKYFDGNSYTGVAHSVLIKTIVELGILGLLCFLFYLFGVLVRLRSSMKDDMYKFVLIAAASGFLFGLVDFSFDVTSHVITFFVLTAFFFAESAPLLESQSTPKKERGSLPVFAFVIASLMVTFLFSSRVSLFRRTIETADLMKENGFALEALYAYRDAIETMPLSNESYIKAISTLVQIYQLEGSEKVRPLMMKELSEYITTSEKKKDRDSELYLILGQAYSLQEDNERARLYFDRALSYYPSSARYVYEIASYYVSRGKADEAMKYIRSFDPYIEKHRGRHNPRGIFVYKIRDLEADFQYKNGDRVEALQIARRNLEDARNNVYVISSARARNFVARDQFVEYLRQKAELYGFQKPKQF
jgi:O-antigen ligase